MPLSKQEIQHLHHTIASVSDYDFKDYSEKSFLRRIEKILIDYRLDFTELIRKIRNRPGFLEQIVKDITVNTTELFRNPQTWNALKFRVLERIKDKSSINIWHAGCSTGQEVYSMLILLNEFDMLEKTNIFATDINTDVLQAAKEGKYVYRFNIDYLSNFDKVIRKNALNFDEYNDVPYSKYFDINKGEDVFQVKKFLLNKAVFRKHDLVKGENIFYRKFDLILCRNVLIYFNHKLQNKVFELFQQSLLPDGALSLGIHESIIGTMSTKFTKKGLIYLNKPNKRYIGIL